MFVLTGSAEMLMADAVSKLAAKTPGKEAVAMEAFAKALRMVLSFFRIKGILLREITHQTLNGLNFSFYFHYLL